MMTFSKIASAAVLSTALLAATGAEAAPRHFWGGVAAGAVGGLIVGNALSRPAPDYYYGPGPGTVIVEEPDDYAPPPPPRRVYRNAPNCTSYTKYDMNGQPYEWKDCN